MKKIEVAKHQSTIVSRHTVIYRKGNLCRQIISGDLLSRGCGKYLQHSFSNEEELLTQDNLVVLIARLFFISKLGERKDE